MHMVFSNSVLSIHLLSIYLSIHEGIDGSAHKPTLVQDTEYMDEKTHHIAPYLGAFGDLFNASVT